MLRRGLLLAGLGIAAGNSRAGLADIPDLSVTIQVGDRTYRYEATNALDLGDYMDPQGQFVQNCALATHPGLPIAVMFRPDRGSERVEIVFELGRVWWGEPVEIDSYRARVFRGASQIASIEVPRHPWFARWRWQSAPRPVRVAIQDLARQGLLPPYDAGAHTANTRPTQARAYEPLGLAGVTPYFPTTGDRDDIGPLTEPQAEYLCTGRAAALATFMAQAEAAGTVPWNIRDERTGAPLDVIEHARASVYGPDVGAPFIKTKPSQAVPDSAHQPALAYLPFVLTGDPYHLETLQFQAAWNVLSLPPNYRHRTVQVRGQAWSLRTLAQAARVTPAHVPRWLLPHSHWRTLLDRQRDWLLEAFVESADPLRAVFRTTAQDFRGSDRDVPRGTSIAPWMEDFEAAMLGWVVRMGFVDWLPVLRWKIGQTIARTDGQSGWMRAYCTPFELMTRAQEDAPFARSWSEAWAINQAAQSFQVQEPDRWSSKQFFMLPYTRAALALARGFGIQEVEPAFNWADREVARAVAQGRRQPYRWAIA